MTLRRMAFDIETQADLARVEEMPEPDVALGNLKDPEKIAAKVAEARDKQIDKMALDPHFGRVICISTAIRSAKTGEVEADTRIRVDVSNDDRDAGEYELLSHFWDRVGSLNPRLFVSFNGSGFDVPFLMRRSLLLDVRPVRIECNKYRVAAGGEHCEHLDLYRLLTEEYGCYSCCSQNLRFFVGEILGEECEYDVDMDKTELGRLFDAGQYGLISKVCTWDTVALLRLCEAVEKHYAI